MQVRMAARARKRMLAPIPIAIFAPVVRGWEGEGEGEEIDAVDIGPDWVVVWESEVKFKCDVIVEDCGINLVGLTDVDTARAVEEVTVTKVFCVVKPTSAVGMLGFGPVFECGLVPGGSIGVKIMVELWNTDELGVPMADTGVCKSVLMSVAPGLACTVFSTTPDTIVNVSTLQSPG
jgi:hypothetical protein